jgi:hypothetical protein
VGSLSLVASNFCPAACLLTSKTRGGQNEDYQPFSAISPEEGADVGHLDPDQRDDNHLDTADGAGSGLMEVSREGAKYLGRGAGSFFVCEDNEVR